VQKGSAGVVAIVNSKDDHSCSSSPPKRRQGTGHITLCNEKSPEV
jgi:hypothetical protein